MSEGYHGVYIGNVDCQSSVEEIRSIFSHCGEIADCKLGGDPMKQFRYAFVNFTNASGREEAMKLDGYRHLKYDLTVRHSTSTPRFQRNQDRYGGGGGAYNNGYGGGGGYGMAPQAAPAGPPPANPQVLLQLQQIMALQAQGQPIDQGQLASLVATLSTTGGAVAAGDTAAAPVQREGPRGNWVPACEDRPPEPVLQYRAAQKQQYMLSIRNMALEHEKKMIKMQESGGSTQSSSSSSIGSDDDDDEDSAAVAVAAAAAVKESRRGQGKKAGDSASSIGSITDEDSDGSDEDEEAQKERRLKAARKAAAKHLKADKKSKKLEKKKEKKERKDEKKDKKREKKEKKRAKDADDDDEDVNPTSVAVEESTVAPALPSGDAEEC